MTRLRLGLVFVSLAVAQENVIIQDALTGPWQEPLSQFEASLQNYTNITGLYTIPGPNLTLSPIGSSSGDLVGIDGWKWNISISGQIPVANVSSAPADENDPHYYTGGELILSAPSSVLGPANGANGTDQLVVNNGWEMCVQSWDLGDSGIAYPDKLRSDNGTCESLLSEECINDMLSYAVPLSGDYFCNCPAADDWTKSSACNKLGSDALAIFQNSTSVSSYFNASQLRDSNGTVIIKYEIGSLWSYHLSNETVYNDVGSLAWPVMVNFNNQGSGELGSMRCVRASTTIAGSQAPIGTTTGAGGHAFLYNWELLAASLMFSRVLTSLY
ncbi:hypothetical protein F5Y16DRAFT_360160 [Xylariaceae sp. FL0255]|nr:hypothetical protein F5Y16DRAFT_360160 [Xylariaceae sp. FL0255]